MNVFQNLQHELTRAQEVALALDDKLQENSGYMQLLVQVTLRYFFTSSQIGFDKNQPKILCQSFWCSLGCIIVCRRMQHSVSNFRHWFQFTRRVQ